MMMNRRGFLSFLAAAVAGVFARIGRSLEPEPEDYGITIRRIYSFDESGAQIHRVDVLYGFPASEFTAIIEG